MSKILGSYVNGNTIVAMYDDGTKVRFVKDGEKPAPEFPESIDLKITNRCNLGCPMCAESSTLDGAHADLNSRLFYSLHPYTELAIGGGNPMEHPSLIDLLYRMKDRNVLCNLTVNAEHFMRNAYILEYFVSSKLIRGLGVSIPSQIPVGFLHRINDFPNAVIHTIAGYTPMEVYDKLSNRDLNLLILGYKSKGRGETFAKADNKVSQLILKTSDRVREFVKSHEFKAVAFDNLAVRQLGVKDVLTEEEYNKLYMGDDGEYTMYIDLVQQKFGKSSSHPLHPINSSNIDELFAQVHKEEKYLWQ